MTVTCDLRHLLKATKPTLLRIYSQNSSDLVWFTVSILLKNQQTRGEPQESAEDPESLTGWGHSGPRAYEAVRALDTSKAASRGYVANNNKTAGGDSKKHSKT